MVESVSYAKGVRMTCPRCHPLFEDRKGLLIETGESVRIVINSCRPRYIVEEYSVKPNQSLESKVKGNE